MHKDQSKNRNKDGISEVCSELAITNKAIKMH